MAFSFFCRNALAHEFAPHGIILPSNSSAAGLETVLAHDLRGSRWRMTIPAMPMQYVVSFQEEVVACWAYDVGAIVFKFNWCDLCLFAFLQFVFWPHGQCGSQKDSARSSDARYELDLV